ncbi:MAG: type II secretion system protein N [Candidatus Sedimenticola sp. (ex Thyasira tokunagai)]
MSTGYSSSKHLQPIALLCAAGVLTFACYSVGLLIINQNSSTTAPPFAGENQSQSKAAGGKEINYNEISQWHLFGKPSSTLPAPQKKVVVVPKTRLKLALLGVFSDQKTGEGWAIISERGGDHNIYRIGGELPGEAILYGVEADRVTLERNGQYESLSLEKPDLNNTANNKALAAPPAARLHTRRSLEANKPKRI